MTDKPTLLLLDNFMSDHVKTIQNAGVYTDIDLCDLFESDVIIIRSLIESNLDRFQRDSIVFLSETEIQQHDGARYAFTDPGVFTLAGLIRTKKAIQIYVNLIELMVGKLQHRAYDIATNYQDSKN